MDPCPEVHSTLGPLSVHSSIAVHSLFWQQLKGLGLWAAPTLQRMSGWGGALLALLACEGLRVSTGCGTVAGATRARELEQVVRLS